MTFAIAALVASAVQMRGTMASVTEILGIMRAVTERLTSVPDADPKHPTVKLELWWVEGVHGTAGGLELPNPLILRDQWVNELFTDAASNYVVAAVEEGRESRLWAGKVARYFEGNRGKGRDPRHQYEGDRDNPQMSVKGEFVIYENNASDEAELIAQAANTVLRADLHYHLFATNDEFRKQNLENQGFDVASALRKRKLAWIESVQLEIPAGASLPQRCALWIRATRAAALGAHVATAGTVLFDNAPTMIRGALVGEQVPENQLLPASPLDDLVEAQRYEKGEVPYGVTLRIGVSPSFGPAE